MDNNNNIYYVNGTVKKINVSEIIRIIIEEEGIASKLGAIALFGEEESELDE